MTSPAFRLFFGKILFFSTAPTAKPAKSYLLLAYIPGNSAVSPPIRAQFAIFTPEAIPFIIFLATFNFKLPVAK